MIRYIPLFIFALILLKLTGVLTLSWLSVILLSAGIFIGAIVLYFLFLLLIVYGAERGWFR